tara:strand:+ start:239 stop:628 length:390 start_codon:yes stop_codon:yes gene_type:complete
MSKIKKINTKKAPSAIGAYSQAIRAGSYVFISGQIPLMPDTMEIVSDNFDLQIKQVLNNISEIVKESNCQLSDIVKINVYLKDLTNFQAVNEAMEIFFTKPYPARAAMEVSRLPKDVQVEIDAIVFSDV